jgi:adenine-specific DNA-methyltransferase
VKPSKPVKSFKHKEAKRAHIPSAEEAGYEAGSQKVREATSVELPLNPIISRGQDPELFWMHKYGSDEKLTAQLDELQAKLKSGDTAGARTALENLRDLITHRYEQPEDESLSVDIRSLYRHEHIAPETLIKGLYRIVAEKSANQEELFAINELFGNAIAHEELDKVSDYYTHSDGWSNRLIQGDSLLVMTSLLEREGMAGQVQCIYIDPPYGIKYGSNWQIRLNNRTVKDGDDDSLSGEPEQIRAFRDTWEKGIHSYLTYLRDRLLVARELLHESGSCFVQISDENVHLVRNLMDEVFGSENFFAQINFKSMQALGQSGMAKVYDYLIWYARDIEKIKFRPIFVAKDIEDDREYRFVDDPKAPNGFRKLTETEFKELKDYSTLFRRSALTSSGFTPTCTFPFELNGVECRPFGGKSWRTNRAGIEVLKEKSRLFLLSGNPYFKLYYDDFPYMSLENSWREQAPATARKFVVQTGEKFIQRCLLMTTDPGDLVLDPTCGSGTTAYVAEQWGRRWITTDTSRIALNIAKIRLTTATFPYYQLHDQQNCDIRQGFIYKKVPHVTLGSIANNEPPEEETLYDQPTEDKKRLRVAGPFTVETLQNYEPISPQELAKQRAEDKELSNFEDLIFSHLKSAGVKTGDKRENAVFLRIDRLADATLHAEGWYQTASGEKKAYLHIGPKFGTVSKQAVTEAIKACRDKRDGDWLLILGFAFESGITELSRNFGHFQVSIVRMHDDLLQQGLLKKDKKAASFVTIGEPDIKLHVQPRSSRREEAQTSSSKKSQSLVTSAATEETMATVEIAGLDIYDPIKDEVKSRDVHDIAYWMVDDNYDGSNFVVRQVFFCGGDKDEFEEWKKGLSDLAKAKTKKAAEQTLKIEIDDEAFSRLYGHTSHPFPVKEGQKVAVRVISQFGEETTKVLEVK